MRTNLIYLFPLLLSLAAGNFSCSENTSVSELENAFRKEGRSSLLFDNDWLFLRGDSTNAEKPGFNDVYWRKLDLPHDWSIENLPGKDTPLDSVAMGGIDAGYFTGGTGWYRKKFIVPADLNGKKVTILFEGIYMNSDVWINGRYLGNHPYGYTSFVYDLTGFLQPGKENVIAVRVRNLGRNSRWYSGSGIYRHVRLNITGPVHLDPLFTFITTPVVNDSEAVVRVKTALFNESEKSNDYLLTSIIADTSGKEISSNDLEQHVEAGGSVEFADRIKVPSPSLWSPDSPVLYSMVNKVYLITGGKKKLCDSISTHFGIRYLAVSAKEGLLLNGEHIMLKGGCMHHDNGPLGAAAFDRAEERRVELMKASGFNAIRCAHNPPSPAFLNACDRLGMLIIDESFDMWTEPKNPDDYHVYFNDWWKKDLESMIRRDRNHPSVIFWSIGNEIPERGKPEGARLAHEQADYIRSLDSTRLITSAVNSVAPDKDPYFAALDICGYNYSRDNYAGDHLKYPERIIVSTESFPLETFDYWMAVKDDPWVIGDFVWTGYDYLGEASIGWLGYPHEGSFYPWNNAFCGDIDICGFKRPQSYYRDVLWRNEKNISVFVRPPVPSFPLNKNRAEWSKWGWDDVVPAWNWEGYKGKEIEVVVYSSCPQTELFLNGKSFGKKNTDRSTRWTATWKVPYEPGKLIARGYPENGETIKAELVTAGEPAKLKLIPDRRVIRDDGQDLCYVIVELRDKNHNVNPAAPADIRFEISGPGTIMAVGNSDPRSKESFTAQSRKTYMGKCLVVIRAGHIEGNIILRAFSGKTGATQTTIKCGYSD